MNQDSFPPENLQKTLIHIRQALFEHGRWYSALIRSVVCKLPANQSFLLPESHTVCKFGMWFHSEDNTIPKDLPKYTAIADTHKAMHEMATTMLAEFDETGAVSTTAYDQFSRAQELFQKELIELEREIENHLYEHDSLTGANSRLGLLAAIKEQQEQIKRAVQTDCCIVMMDLDDFKDVNDTYGHAAGDTVLSAIVHNIDEQLRPYDSIFRYGGEEFLILMPHTDLTNGMVIVERLRAEIASAHIDIGSDKHIQITASFGVTTLSIDQSITQSIEIADKAMYAAKAAGKNCVKSA